MGKGSGRQNSKGSRSYLNADICSDKNNIEPYSSVDQNGGDVQSSKNTINNSEGWHKNAPRNVPNLLDPMEEITNKVMAEIKD